MHDFYLTIPYGLLLVGEGFSRYFSNGSIASLGGGLYIFFGSLLIIAGYLSYKAFDKRENSILALLLEIFCVAELTRLMGQRYLHTSEFMPGLVAGISALMTGFYLFKWASGGNHIPARRQYTIWLQPHPCPEAV